MIDGTEKLNESISTTERGFGIYKFEDLYNKPCELQESSIATAECIWLGISENRMHLNREQAKSLGKILLEFADKGDGFWEWARHTSCKACDALEARVEDAFTIEHSCGRNEYE